MTQPTSSAPDAHATAAASGPALSDARYRRLADQALASIEGAIDTWLDADVVDIDAQRTGGLLELSFPDRSKIIVNTQPPLHELWLAARAGGFHYRWVDGAWRDTRSGEGFFAALSQHASQQAGVALSFSVPAALAD